jgi:hypothetical protein
MSRNVVGYVIANVILNRRRTVDVRADLRKNLVPRAANLRIQIAPMRAQVLVETTQNPVRPQLDHPDTRVVHWVRQAAEGILAKIGRKLRISGITLFHGGITG